MVLLGTGESSEGKTDLFARSGRREGGLGGGAVPAILRVPPPPGHYALRPGRSIRPPSRAEGLTSLADARRVLRQRAAVFTAEKPHLHVL